MMTDKARKESLKKAMMIKGSQMEKADTAFGKLTEAEKIFINSYMMSKDISVGSTIINCGLADNFEDAIAIGISLLKNPRIKAALSEIKKLGGVTPARVKQGILDLAENSQDENIQLRAWTLLGKYEGLETPVKTIEQEIKDVKMIEASVKGSLQSILEDAETHAKNLKASIDEEAEKKREKEYQEIDAFLSDDDIEEITLDEDIILGEE